MKSQEGQCAPVFSPTQGPVCQDVAALVIISGAHKLFPVAVACVSAPNWEKGQGDRFFSVVVFFLWTLPLLLSKS